MGRRIFITNLSAYERFTHFEYIPVAGGDAVSKEPWRSTVSYLYHYFGEAILEDLPFFTKNIKENHLKNYLQLLKTDFNTYKISSAGRLFDAVSSLLGLVHVAGYHAEAPMRLESIVNENINDYYEFEITDVISFKKTFAAMLSDLKTGLSISIISAKFHNSLAEVVLQISNLIKQKTGITKVVLSGGTFQNKYLIEKVENQLSENDFQVYAQEKIPANDGGIALGQLIIGANV